MYQQLSAVINDDSEVSDEKQAGATNSEIKLQVLNEYNNETKVKSQR